MKVAVCGKGGIGKTTISAGLTRALAERGRVLALDFDVNPGLDMALGELDGQGLLPRQAVEPRSDGQYGWGLAEGLSPRDAVAAFASWGPDRLRFLSLGRIETADHDLSSTHYAVRQVAQGFDEPGWSVIVDMEAGTKDVYDGSYVDFVDRLLLLTDGSEVGNLTCRRLASIASAQGSPGYVVAANRAKDPGSVIGLAEDLAAEFVGEVPYDETVRAADREGTAVWDMNSQSPSSQAIREMVDRLELVIDGR